MATGKAQCVTCRKEKSTVICDGCSQRFCVNHFGDHRKELSQLFDKIEVNRDLFRQAFNEQTAKPDNDLLMKQIDQWEEESTNKIKQTADEARQLLQKYTVEHLAKLEVKLNKLTSQLRESREENDYSETDIHQWTKHLTRMTTELDILSHITVKHESTSLVNKISVHLAAQSGTLNIDANAQWTKNGVTMAGGNAQGVGANQLYNPRGLYIDVVEVIYIADSSNHRIVEWKIGAVSGQVVAGGNGKGNRNDQLNNPSNVIVDKENDSLIICDRGNQRVVRWPLQNGRSGETIIADIGCFGLAMDNNGYLYVSDYSKHEVRQWKMGDTNSTVVAGGNGKGNHPDQLNGPCNIFVDEDHSVYVSNRNNHRVMKWMKGANEGIVVAGSQGEGNGLTQLSNPHGVVVDQLDTVYVADYGNHRVMRWSKGATEGSVIVGGNGKGGGANQLHCPWSLSFDRQGNLYVADMDNHRVQKFNIAPSSYL